MRKRAAERMGQEPPELQRKQGRSHQSCRGNRAGASPARTFKEAV